MQRAPWKKQIKMPTVFQWLTYIRFLWRSSGYRLPAGLVGGEVFSFASSKYIITTVLLSVFFSGEGQSIHHRHPGKRARDDLRCAHLVPHGVKDDLTSIPIVEWNRICGKDHFWERRGRGRVNFDASYCCSPAWKEEGNILYVHRLL